MEPNLTNTGTALAAALEGVTRPGPRTLFVIGCPRSGTTWMQLLLSQNTRVATAPETQIFSYYLDRFRRQWREEHEGHASEHQGGAGLSRLLTPEDFRNLCRTVASSVLDRILERNPDAAVIVEKSPRHALLADWIEELFPEACFLHVVRDPRDVAASMFAAGASWAQWAPRGAVQAGRLWKDHIEGARRVRNGGGRYREIRYESLRADPAGELGGVLEWLDLPAVAADIEAAVEACKLSRLQTAADGDRLPLPGRESPRGFFRRGDVGGWRDELTPSSIRVLEEICGDLMAGLGYERTTASSRGARTRIRAHDFIQRVRGGVDWRLDRLAKRI